MSVVTSLILRTFSWIWLAPESGDRAAFPLQYTKTQRPNSQGRITRRRVTLPHVESMRPSSDTGRRYPRTRLGEWKDQERAPQCEAGGTPSRGFQGGGSDQWLTRQKRDNPTGTICYFVGWSDALPDACLYPSSSFSYDKHEDIEIFEVDAFSVYLILPWPTN